MVPSLDYGRHVLGKKDDDGLHANYPDAHPQLHVKLPCPKVSRINFLCHFD